MPCLKKIPKVYRDSLAIRRDDGKILNERVPRKLRKIIDHRNILKEVNNVTSLSNACTANLA